MMRLRAIRLADVRRFTVPIAVEGFGDGLNVLSGPNELGKSTLLKALDALLRIKYTATGKQLDELVPYTGGAPTIEAEFEANGHLWRLRKQFLSARSATLLDLTTGTLLKNADAETRLAALNKSTLEFDRFGLLWVRQGDFAAPLDGSGDLTGLIVGEVAAVSLDARSRAVHEAIRDALKPLQTDTGKAKTKGSWSNAIKAHEAAVQRLAVAETNARKQTQRLDALSTLTADRAALLLPDAVAARTDKLADARTRFTAAADARRQRNEAAAILKTAFAALQTVEREDQQSRTEITEFERLAHDSANAHAREADLRRRHTDCTSELTTAQTNLDRETAADAVLQAEQVAARDALHAAGAAADRDKLSERITDVRSAMTAQQQATSAAASLAAVTEPRVKALHVALGELARLDAALAAAAPEVTITIEPGSAGRILVDGTALSANATFNPDTPLEIDIPGVGRIGVAPNPATVGPVQRAAREQCRAEIEAAYATLGATTPAECDARLASRQAADTTCREAAIRIAALAPQGLDALVAAHAELSARAATADSGFDPANVASLDARITAHRQTHLDARVKVQAAQQALNALAIDIARHEQDASNRAQQLAALQAKLGDATAQQSARAALADKLTAARSSYTAAKSAADAWSSVSDADRVEALEAEVRAAESAIKTTDDLRVVLDQQIYGLERELSVASDEDVETELENARAAAAATGARLADIDADVAALNMLDREFQAITEASRRELTGPIVQRIQPYLAQIFPDARLELGNQLAPVQLLRNGCAEPHGQLSDGTREQIAILVRLGLAHLLADKGHAAPLILDDALVYSDDQRISQMFKALQDAARLHQVIVLNCREQAFSSLARAPGTTVLRFQPWAQSALAA